MPPRLAAPLNATCCLPARPRCHPHCFPVCFSCSTGYSDYYDMKLQQAEGFNLEVGGAGRRLRWAGARRLLVLLFEHPVPV